LALGRLANFINGELIGKQFSGRWCVIFPNYDNLCRHPYVLYEAGKRFILLGWLSILYFKEKFKEGFIFWNFIFFEGLGRFVLDFYKEDIFYLFFTPGQWMSLVMIVAAGYALMRGHREDWKRIF
jgi:phosphatidylglycerol:prolipoprotein diacylglycerol transferase